MVNVQAIPSPAIHTDERAHEADHPTSLLARFGKDQPLKLDCGIDLAPFQIAYQTYGELNAERSNAILVCHALTGDQHVANVHPVTGKPGWWETMVGPGRSTGPASTNPATGKFWGLDFPIITIPDMVRAQAMLLDRLGIDTLFCVVGGSMGGMQALQWTAAYPARVFSVLAVACSTRHSAQNIAFHELGRQAVMADPDWHSGRYFEKGTHPHRGLGVARMPRISPTSRTPPCTASLAGGCRTASCRRSRSTPISRSKAICAIRAPLSWSGSTPTAISI